MTTPNDYEFPPTNNILLSGMLAASEARRAQQQTKARASAIASMQTGIEAAYAEHDPTGRNAHDPGAKLDAGKNRLGLVLGGFSNALAAVGALGTYGANKYTDNGWRSVPNGVERYTDALWRHLLAEAGGDALDGDTGLPHAAHAAWNALARLELLLAAVEA